MDKVICIKEFTKEHKLNVRYIGKPPVVGNIYYVNMQNKILAIHLYTEDSQLLSSVMIELYKESFMDLDEWRQLQLNKIL